MNYSRTNQHLVNRMTAGLSILASNPTAQASAQKQFEQINAKFETGEWARFSDLVGDEAPSGHASGSQSQGKPAILCFYRDSSANLLPERSYGSSQSLISAQNLAHLKKSLFSSGIFPEGAVVYACGLVGSALSSPEELTSNTHVPLEHARMYAEQHAASFREIVLVGSTAIGTVASQLVSLFEGSTSDPPFQFARNATITILRLQGSNLRFSAAEAALALNREAGVDHSFESALALCCRHTSAVAEQGLSSSLFNQQIEELVASQVKLYKNVRDTQADPERHTSDSEQTDAWMRDLRQHHRKRILTVLANVNIEEPRRRLPLPTISDVLVDEVELDDLADTMLMRILEEEALDQVSNEIVAPGLNRAAAFREKMRAEEEEYLASASRKGKEKQLR